MKYPQFLKNDDTIGVVAMSAGVGEYLEDYEKSLATLKRNNWQIKESKSVRVASEVANSGRVRASELDEMVKDDTVKLVMCATGGDFAIEMLPYVNWQNIENNIKWYMGASDPTSFLFALTTNWDIATIYGFNACSFDQKKPHSSLKKTLDIMQGNIDVQKSYSLYEKNKELRNDGYNLEEKVYWEDLNGEVSMKGRIIGGCLDVLRDLIGTKYDKTKEFIEKYKKDGIIWYFDVFSLTSEDFYRTLFQMKEAGWFKYVKGIVVGRVLFPRQEYKDFSYQKALKKIFGYKLPIIFNADIGHVAPTMTIINGSLAYIKCSRGKGIIEMKLE